MDIQPDLSVCLLHRDADTDGLAAFLDSLHTHADPVSFEVILVAGQPDSPSLARLEHEFPGMTILENQAEQSLVMARNHAFRLGQGRFLSCWDPHLLLRPATLPLLIGFLDENPDVGMAAPRIVAPDGKVLPTIRTVPSLTSVLASHPDLGPRLGLTANLPRHLLADRDHLLPMEAEWLLDTCLVIRQELVEEVGLFDEGFRDHYADADLCLRARRAGWHLHYTSDAVAVLTSSHNLPSSSLLSDGARFLFKKWLIPINPAA